MVGSFPWVTIGAPTDIDGAVCIAVAAETLMYLGRNALLATLWCLVD